VLSTHNKMLVAQITQQATSSSTVPFAFENVRSEVLDLDHARVKLSVPMPPSMIEDETYATNDVSMSDYCKLAKIMQSMPQIDDNKHDFDLGVELRSGPSSGAQYEFILYTDRVKWSHLMAKKDLHPELLRW